MIQEFKEKIANIKEGDSVTLYNNKDNDVLLFAYQPRKDDKYLNDKENTTIQNQEKEEDGIFYQDKYTKKKIYYPKIEKEQIKACIRCGDELLLQKVKCPSCAFQMNIEVSVFKCKNESCNLVLNYQEIN
ncbi:hypothetical protein PPERSA_09555 [Pseudocohnilembus persalinus]|uniref:Uncharacterized protein n=1 Tax=Pseudocohnilembus persalinus TaxID=266149 RepID=A0A0V0QFM3_PSEPJ|nr:hypothetical protein PPERSA_09555 [Pseudocohnilembus persalinus]|eukprot:KRX00949.1 hypothetical protein PPERSA_09555 [Pseudocohnilembus persalinus]